MHWGLSPTFLSPAVECAQECAAKFHHFGVGARGAPDFSQFIADLRKFSQAKPRLCGFQMHCVTEGQGMRLCLDFHDPSLRRGKSRGYGVYSYSVFTFAGAQKADGECEPECLKRRVKAIEESDEDRYTSGVKPITTSNFAASSPMREPGNGAKGTITEFFAFGSRIPLRMPSLSFPGSPLM